jgi:hypothetical protein
MLVKGQRIHGPGILRELGRDMVREAPDIFFQAFLAFAGAPFTRNNPVPTHPDP